MKNRVFKKADFFIILAVLAVSAALIFIRPGSSGHRTAVISVGSEVIKEIDLDAQSEKTVITPDTDPRIVIVCENGGIRFESSECRDKICVRAGILTEPGDVAVCLPARAVISIKGSGPDAVTY